MLVIEHNPDVIKCADYIIDLGPEGGDEGGHIVAEGTPEEVAEVAKSYTGQVLRKLLAAHKEPEPTLAPVKRRKSRRTPVAAPAG